MASRCSAPAGLKKLYEGARPPQCPGRCGNLPPRGFGQLALQHAPRQSQIKPRQYPASARLGPPRPVGRHAPIDQKAGLTPTPTLTLTLTLTFTLTLTPTRYQPMKKQGAIILGIGGDSSDRAIGTFYEGVMTTGYPNPNPNPNPNPDPNPNPNPNQVMTTGYATDATDLAVHANIAAAGYGK
eukprot:scaffold21302_cov50-Phaeocystis_antarctica.AAC.7